jgi:CubicO group peptidase (beta-lactamase class C family)
MTQTSQNLNRSYGYLWWLNGKPSYMVPTSQLVFPGSYAPAAPPDMYAGLGKNGQILSVSKSLGLVVVRMGNQTSSGEVPTQLCNSIWEKLNAVVCSTTSDEAGRAPKQRMMLFPNPAHHEVTLTLPNADPFEVEIRNAFGQIVSKNYNTKYISIANLPEGFYMVCVNQGKQHYIEKIIKAK